MLIGSGSIRAEKLGPIVTYGDLIEGFPYDDGVYMFKVTGRQLRQMLRYMLREEAYAGHTEFYQLPSTLRLRYDRAKGDFDYFTYCGKEVGKEIGDDALFTVGLPGFTSKTSRLFQHLLRYHLQAAEAPQRGNLLSGYPDGILPGARDAGCRRGRQNDHSAPGRSGRLNAPPGKTPFPQKGNSTKKGTLFRQKLTLLPNGSLKEIFFTTERSAP